MHKGVLKMLILSIFYLLSINIETVQLKIVTETIRPALSLSV